MSTIRRRDVQRRKCLWPRHLPLMDPLLQRMFPRNTQMAPIIPSGYIIAKVYRLGEEPNGTVHPVTVAEDRFDGPPLAEAVVEWGECQPQAFLVCECELDVLDDEDPEGG